MTQRFLILNARRQEKFIELYVFWMYIEAQKWYSINLDYFSFDQLNIL